MSYSSLHVHFSLISRCRFISYLYSAIVGEVDAAIDKVIFSRLLLCLLLVCFFSMIYHPLHLRNFLSSKCLQSRSILLSINCLQPPFRFRLLWVFVNLVKIFYCRCPDHFYRSRKHWPYHIYNNLCASTQSSKEALTCTLFFNMNTFFF